MKADIIFLRELSKELRFLNDEEKDITITEYRTKINERYQKGEELKRIVASFEPPKTIARKVYDRAGFKYEFIEKRSQSNFLTLKWLSAFLSLIPQSILLFVAIILIAAGLIVGIGTIGVFVLIWMNFAPAQAWGPAILALGLLPLIAVVLFLVGRQFFRFEWVLVKSLWKTLTGKIFKTKEANIAKAKITKIFFIIFVSLLTGLTIIGSVGTFVGDKSLGQASISGNLLHTQTEVLDLAEFTNENEEPIKISFDALQSISWYRFTFIEDTSMESNLKIEREHNTKETLKIDFSVEKHDEDFAIKTKMPWNLLAFNISSNKFTLRYNPLEIDFGV